MDIAVIGMAGRFPEADNLAAFYRNLRAGRNSVREIAAGRKQQTFPGLEVEFEKGGYLEDIAHFDHRFFNISLNEARNMDPNQRLALELVYEILENAGYNPDHFYNSNTSVWVGETPMQYSTFVTDRDPTFTTGNLSALIAGRVSRFFNLRGGAQTIGTACSSSLVALHYACNELRLGQSDHAIVCGLSLYLLPPVKNNGGHAEELGANSPDGKVCSFSNDANGPTAGEAVAGVLLKPLEKALADKDIIHAVIKASAINQDAALSGSLAAPDSVAQSQVIKKAWAAGHIDPATITYIEANATGAKLADAIEVQGLDLAFGEFTGQKKYCALSTVKTNIGHADSASGIAGLIKAILALKFKKLFPLANFTKPNAFINFEHSACYPVTEEKEWSTENEDPRRAGVSSFGLAGTNCHVVLEEAPLPNNQDANDLPPGEVLITVSAKDPQALAANINALCEHLAITNLPVHDISHTLNTGRKHYEYRFAAIVEHQQELTAALRDFKGIAESPIANRKFVFIFSDTIKNAKQYIKTLATQSTHCTQAMQKVLETFEETGVATSAAIKNTFVLQYGLYSLLESAYPHKILLGDGLGKTVNAIFSGDLTLEQAIRQLPSYKPQPLADTRGRCTQLLQKLGNGPLAFVEIGPENTISAALKALAPEWGHYTVTTLAEPASGLLGFMKELYLHNYEIDWKKAASLFKGNKIELPAYRFNKIYCWAGAPRLQFSTLQVTDTVPAVSSQQAPVPESPSENNDPRLHWTNTERKVAAYWTYLLGTKELLLEDDFFRLGGHSLYGYRLINKIRNEFDVDFELTDLFTNSRLQQMAAYIDGLVQTGKQNRFGSITPLPAATHYEVSHAQRRLWVINQMDDETRSAYNIFWRLTLKGELNEEAFSKAVTYIINRHESLRTTFHMIGSSLRQQIQPMQDWSSVVLYENAAGHSDLPGKIRQYVQHDQQQKFDLEKGPLLSIRLVRIEEQQYVVFFTIHHIVFDGLSQRNFASEFLSCYEAYKKGTEPGLYPMGFHYKDFAAWQNQLLEKETAGSVKNYWLDIFKEPVPILHLNADHKRPAIKTYKGSKIEFVLDPALLHQLKTARQATDTTLFMFFLSAVYVLLYHNTYQEDIVVGTPVSGRQHAELEHQVGLYINTLPLRMNINGNNTFAEVLEKVRHRVIQSLDNQLYPFDKLVDDLQLKRDISRHPLFDVIVTLDHRSGYKEDQQAADLYKKITKDSIEAISTTLFDITFNFVVQGQQTLLSIEYNTDLFWETSIERLGRQCMRLLPMLCESMDTRIGQLDLLEAEERARLLQDADNDPNDYPGHQTIVSVFEEQVDQTPANIAVVFEEHQWSYSCINEKSNQLASYLRRQYPLKPGDRIGIMVSRSQWMIVGLMGILKSGAAYVPVDPLYPAERKAYILENAGVKCLLTDEEALPPLNDINSINLKSAWDTIIRKEPTHNLPPLAVPADMAYVIYTSGSTGKPKGCMVEHRNVINLLKHKKDLFRFTSHDVWIMAHSFCFDFSVWEMYGALLNGGKLIIPDLETVRDSARLYRLIKSKRVSVLNQTPGAFYNLIEEQNRDEEKTLDQHLRYVIFGGDKLNLWQLKDWENTYGLEKIRLINMYGITETTVHVSHYEIQHKDIWNGNGASLIGRAIPGMEIYILNQWGCPVQEGVEGELYIGGHGVSRGYLGNEQLTEDRFIPHLFAKSGRLYKSGDLGRWLPDGTIEYIGRKDAQVKLRGYRIEPGEIENVLSAYPGIESAVVTLRGEGADKYLAAYYKAGTPVSDGVIRDFLAANLPRYMVPAYILEVAAFPLTGNGKLDRSRLPDPVTLGIGQAEIYMAPRNETEAILAEIWEKVLGRKQIGITDSFFDLGGDSIKAIMVSTRLLKYGLQLDLQHIYKNPTIEKIAEWVTSITGDRKIDQSPVTGEAGLTPIQQAFFQAARTTQHHFNQSVLLNAKQSYEIEGLRKVVEKLQEHHDALRMTFRHEAGEWKQINNGLDHPVGVEEYDLRQVPDARQVLEEQVNAVQAGIDLEKGPLMQVRLFRMTGGDRLLIVIHHLVVDGVSWRILFEDLTSLYEQYRAGTEMTLPPKTNAYKEWAARLQEYANSQAFQLEHTYWDRLEKTPVTRLVPYQGALQNLVKDSESLHFTLSKEDTTALLTRTNRAYGTGIDDLLLTALGIGIEKEFGHRKVLIGREGHGRESIAADLDISRTVGWFTSIYPVVLDMSFTHDLPRQIKEVKETLRNIPGKGIGHGILKYLTRPEYKKEISFNLEPEISFNYLGQFDAELSEASLETAPEPAGHEQHGEGTRDFLVDVAGMVSGGQLMISITYNKKWLDAQRIHRLKDNYQQALKTVIDHCTGKKYSELTPSDLTYKQLSIEEVSLIAPPGTQDIYQLSPMQEGMLFHSLYNPSSAVYFQQFSYSLHFSLQIEWVEKSLQELYKRHEIIRTVFRFSNLERPLQVVLQEQKADFTFHDLRHITDPAGKEQLIREFKQQDRAKYFDLQEGPLMRINLLQLEDDRYEFIWSHHHILMDGWCIKMLTDEYAEIYSSFLENRPYELPPVMQYKNHIQWLSRQDAATAGDYWSQYLAGYEKLSGLPRKQRAAATTAAYDRGELLFSFNTTQTAALTALAGKYQVTLNSLMETLWGVLLGKYNDKEEVVFGTVVSGRPPIEGIETMIGLFINTIPVRIRWTASTRFCDLLQQVQAQALEGIHFHHHPLASIQSASHLKQGLLDHILVFQNVQRNNYQGGNNEIQNAANSHSNVEVFEQTNYGFNVFITPGENLEIAFYYNRHWYEYEFIRQVLHHLQQLAEEIVASPMDPINAFNLLTPAERDRLLNGFNRPASAFPADKTVISLFDEQADRWTDKVAVSCEDRTMTYARLQWCADRTAACLQAQYGIGPGDVVALVMQRSAYLPAAIMGIFKTGASYLPLAAESSTERMQYMLTDSGCKLLLVDAIYQESLQPLTSLPVVSWEQVKQEWKKETAPLQSQYIDSSAQAYVMYTSGTTGKPKGVQIAHRSLVNFLTSMAHQPGMTPDDRLLALSGYTFDISLLELLLPLVTGGQLILATAKEIEDREAFFRVCDRHRPTLIQATPSLWSIILQWGWPGAPGLTILCGGEPLHLALAQSLLDKCAALWNMYGPTETTIWSTCKQIDSNDTQITVGQAIANTRLYVLDSHRQPVPVGVEGDVYIAGEGVAIGYIGQETLTREKFSLDPFSPGGRLYNTGDRGNWTHTGELVIAGRHDSQVKLRGHRIELQEIENNLVAYGLTTARVVIRGEGDDRYLAAYYEQSEVIVEGALRDFLKKRLPAVMIPSFIIPLPNIPLTLSGKLDHKSLPDPRQSGAGRADRHVPPRNQMEKLLVEIWEKVLKLEKISVLDDFFQLGGDSIKTILVTDKLKQRGCIVDIQQVYNNPVLEDLAAAIAGELPATGQPALWTPAQFIPPSFNKEDPYTQYEELVQLLEATWKRVFDRDKIGQEENFFQLGGPVIVAAFLLHAVYREMSLNVSIADIYNYPTIGQLAMHLSTGSSRSEKLVVALQPTVNKNRPAIVFLPTATGIPVEYMAISRNIQDTFNCYALLAHSFDDREPLADSLEELLQNQAGSILKNIKAGEITLLGYSWSVFLAFELAKRLEDAGRQVKLILVDMLPDNKMYVQARKWTMEEYDHLFEVELEGMPSYCTQALKKVYLNNLRLSRDYQTIGVVKADILAIEAANNKERVGMEVWSGYTDGEFRHVMADGHHWELFGNRYSERMTEQILAFAGRQNISSLS